MNRGSKLFGHDDRGRLRNTYERVLALTDLTAGLPVRSAFRKEILRWRDLVAQLYLDLCREGSVCMEAHARAFECLLLFTPEAARLRPRGTPVATHKEGA
jgi:hypothetical protein